MEEESIHEEEISAHSFELPPMHHYKSSIIYYFFILLLHFWNIASTICLIVIQSLKLYYFPSPKSDRDFSMVAPFLLFLVNVIKLICAKYGNRSEYLVLSIVAAVLTVFSIFLNAYFIAWQIYVWHWELPIVIISIILNCIFLIITIILIIYFALKKEVTHVV